MYDAADRLLYVGFSTNVKARVRQHFKTHTWVDREVVRVEISERLAGEMDARAAERRAIRLETPRYNKSTASR